MFVKGVGVCVVYVCACVCMCVCPFCASKCELIGFGGVAT